MPIYFQGKKISRMGALTEPSTYDTDTQAVDVQAGCVYYAQGERRIGSGKAFEYADYGLRQMEKVTDSNGIERFGTVFESADVNVIVASNFSGDSIAPISWRFEIQDAEVTIADNLTAGGELKAYRDGERLIIYLTEHTAETSLLFFVGKDNHIEE